MPPNEELMGHSRILVSMERVPAVLGQVCGLRRAVDDERQEPSVDDPHGHRGIRGGASPRTVAWRPIPTPACSIRDQPRAASSGATASKSCQELIAAPHGEWLTVG